MTLLGGRRDREEILDGRGQGVGELTRSLGHVSAVNRWLGGDRSILLHLRPLLRLRGPRLTLLDVGVGDADLLRRLAGELEGAARLVGVEIHPGIVRVARERTRALPRVRVIRADGLSLPFSDDAFDVALSSLTLHHLPDAGARRLLREMARVSRARILVSDLERCVANYAGALLLSSTLWRTDPITRNDGPLSVLRSFTPAELRRLAEAAGLARARVHRHFFFRLLLEARPPPTGSESEREG